ncbi:MAG: TldD/PmbA family protein [Peptococcaceae bacterium]|nr:TldD/PmbA family protein [Peptococcaceae bacterium]
MKEEDNLLILAGVLDLVEAGAQGEAYLQRRRRLNIEVREGRVETLQQAGDHGLGLRVINDFRLGFAYTTDLSREGLARVAAQAHANAAAAAPDEYRRFPAPAPPVEGLFLYDDAVRQVPVAEKIDLALAMERAAREEDGRVSIIESSVYQDEEVEVAVANSGDLRQTYRSANFAAYVALVASADGDSQTGFALDQSLKYGDLKTREVGREAARRAVGQLGARPVQTREMVVLLDPYVTGGFLGLVAPALTGEAVLKGRSLFAGRVGRQVAAEHVTLVDDGTLTGGVSSAPVDDEGVPTSRTVLVEHGRLNGYMHNTYTAARLGGTSTGNGTRGSFKSTPETGVTNFYLEPGTADPAALMSDLAEGFLVTEVLGMHTANPISGDFSVGATGRLIRNGRLAEPVRGVAIAGNVMDLLLGIEAVANDLRFIGGIGAPTVRVKRMHLSGH